jgi:polar amino acid transport system substrate-binding protein
MNLIRRALLVATFAASIASMLDGCSTQPTISSSDRASLAPTGSLRVGVYSGSPSSIVVDQATGDARGVGYDLGRALAQRLGVPFKPVVFSNNGLALAAVKNGDVDVVFTNASPARARDMNFTPPFMDVEKSFLVVAGSPLTLLDDMKRPGLRVGVSDGSSTASELIIEYPTATLVATPTLKAAIAMLADGKLDAFATNDAILYEMSDSLPGSRVLRGSWGMEHFAAGIPKGRDGLAVVTAFIEDAKRDGTVEKAVKRAGLRGSVPAKGS